MDKSQPSPAKGIKEARHEFLNYVEEIKSRLDVFQIAAARGLTVDKNGQAECFNGHDSKTLGIISRITLLLIRSCSLVNALISLR